MKYDSGIFCGQPVGIHRGLHLWYRRWCDHQAGIGRHECCLLYTSCEVLLGTAGNHLFCGDAYDAVTIARIGQKAENIYFGKPSGLMDQTASSVGDTVAIDFENPEAPVVRPIEANLEGLGLALCIIDCGADLSLIHILRQINDSSDGVYYYVCNRDGEMIYHPRQSEMSRGLFAEDSSAAAGYEDGVYEMPSGGSTEQVIVGSIAYTGWKLIGVIPQNRQTTSRCV